MYKHRGYFWTTWIGVIGFIAGVSLLIYGIGSLLLTSFARGQFAFFAGAIATCVFAVVLGIGLVGRISASDSSSSSESMYVR